MGKPALAERGYAEPTPVQAAVLEAGLNDQDLLVSAQTGSGKTVAFGLALAPTLLGDRERFGPPAEPVDPPHQASRRSGIHPSTRQHQPQENGESPCIS